MSSLIKELDTCGMIHWHGILRYILEINAGPTPLTETELGTSYCTVFLQPSSPSPGSSSDRFAADHHDHGADGVLEVLLAAPSVRL